jgi:hypothetical protein
LPLLLVLQASFLIHPSPPFCRERAPLLPPYVY